MGEQQLPCQSCKETIRVPDLSKSQRETIALLCVADSVKAAEAIRTVTGWDLHAAKLLVTHLSSVRGVCRRCTGALAAPVSACPHCAAANIDWLP